MARSSSARVSDGVPGRKTSRALVGEEIGAVAAAGAFFVRRSAEGAKQKAMPL